MTKTTHGQVWVDSKSEIIDYFEKAGYQDCRVSLFGKYEIDNHIPNAIFFDLDDKQYLNFTLDRLYKMIRGRPAVINTGRGIAIVQPVNMISITNERNYEYSSKELANEFLRFSARYISKYHTDPANHPSLSNTLVRIPDTINSKNEEAVKVLYNWDKNVADSRLLPFKAHLKQKQEKEAKYQQYFKNKKRNNPKTTISYIESILHSPTPDNFRERIVSLILIPYLLNVKNQSAEDTINIITKWSGKRFSQNEIRYKVNRTLKNGILPIAQNKLKEYDSELYGFLKSRY